MSVQRYINASFWDDEFITELDPSEKLLYMYLLTNPLTNIAGVYKITIKRICFDTGFNSNTVLHILDKFKENGKVFKFDEYIVIKSWCKYQSWETSPKIKQGIIKTLKSLSDDLLQFLYSINFAFDLSEVKVFENKEQDIVIESEEDEYTIDTVSYPMDSVSNSSNYIDLNLNRDIDLNSNTNSNSKSDSYTESKPNNKSYTKTEYDLAFKAYLDNYNLLKQNNNKLPDSPTLDYKVIKSMLKYNFNTFGVEKTITGIKNSVNDKWLIENGYRFTTILSSKIITRLIDNCISQSSNNKICFFEQTTNNYEEGF